MQQSTHTSFLQEHPPRNSNYYGYVKSEKKMMDFKKHTFDIFVIGGGINGAGIARDASGRGLKVCLADMGDLGGATSSSSTKLFHGGLRYLEYFEFKLIKETLFQEFSKIKK